VLAVQTQPGNNLQTAERDSPMVADHASMVPEKSGPSAGGPSPSLRPWCVGVLIGGEVYLFDPLEGVPIPGPNGVQFDTQGKLDLTPATLEQAKSDPAILKGMDASPSNPYPLQAADLKAVTAWIEASPEYLALRMKLLEPHFLGKQKLVLSVSPSAELKRWKEAAGVADAQLWLYPYVTLRQRARLPVPLILRQLVSFLPFYAIPEVPVSKERVVQVPLYKGRILHLKGRLAGELGAMQYYQLSRFSPEEMNHWKKEKVQMLVQGGMKEQKDLDEAEATRREAQLRERAELLMQGHLGLILQGKQDATYWLGLVAYQRGNYKAAIDYLSTRTLDVWPEGPWAHGAKYNFARSAEALGDLDRAVLLYQSDPTAPDAPGRLLRAKWLQTQGRNQNRNPAGG
jgi:tetratricopeptide (TPR) repeat protein